MCGIVGILGSKAPRLGDFIPEMLKTIQHRGPDDFGMVVDTEFALGHARLSIIDIKSGAQPFSDPTERYWLAFNGEIFNFKSLRVELESFGFDFQTESDTEVLL